MVKVSVFWSSLSLLLEVSLCFMGFDSPVVAWLGYIQMLKFVRETLKIEYGCWTISISETVGESKCQVELYFLPHLCVLHICKMCLFSIECVSYCPWRISTNGTCDLHLFVVFYGFLSWDLWTVMEGHCHIISVIVFASICWQLQNIRVYLCHLSRW